MSGPTSSPHDSPVTGSHFQPSLSVVLLIVVLFVGATFLMVRAASPTSGGTGTTTTTTAAGGTTTLPARVVKSRVRVQVANGTKTPSLAAHYTQLLQTKNWDTLPPVNGPNEKATVIYYTSTFKSAALEVASTIKVNASVVKPLGKASPVAGASGDDVIVILGPNSAIK